MAANDPSHRRNQSANSIPLQDLGQNGARSEEADLGLGRLDSHRRNFSDRVAALRPGSRRLVTTTNRRYEPLSHRSPSPPTARAGQSSPVAFVTSPTGHRQRIPNEEDEAAYSPIRDAGAFQAAIGFAGLSYDASSPSRDEDEEWEEPGARPTPARGARPSLPSLRTNYDSTDDLVPVQLHDGPEFYSPGARDEDDTLPLTDAPRSGSRITASDGPSTPPGQRHDRSRGFGSALSVRFVGGPSPSRSPSGSMLGDDLRASDTESREPRLGRSGSSRKRSLSPASAESRLWRTGTMLRKMSQRVVNVSNEGVDALVSRSMKRRPSVLAPSPDTETERPDNESHTTDFATLDGAQSKRSEKSSSSAGREEFPLQLPKIDRNPLRGKSLGMFSPQSRLRQNLLELLVNPLCEAVILLLIIIQTVILAIDSARNVYSHPRPARFGKQWTDWALFGIFCVYSIEIMIKVIVSGFIWNPREYSTIDRSIGVREALRKKANELFALHRKPTQKDPKHAPDRPEAPASLLRTFTVDTFDEAAGGSRYARKKRLAHRAFLRHSFNRVDFVAVLAFWISFLLNFFELQSVFHIYVFNMMSCLRIIRLLGITSGTSVILRSLKRAAPLLLNVAFLIGFFWLLFAIVGVQAFKASLRRTCVWDGPAAFPPQSQNYTLNYPDGNGNIQYCGGWLHPNGTRMPWLLPDGSNGASAHKGYICPVGSYCVQGPNPYNGTVSFDNIGNSLELVFVILSTNTFADIMYNLTETDYLASALFFAAGIVILTLWLVNLLIAVITSSFQVIREESRSSAFMAEATDAEKDATEEDSDIRNNPELMRKEPALRRFYHKLKWFWILVIVFGLLVNCTRNATMGNFLKGFIYLSELGVTFILFCEIIIRFIVDWRDFIKHFENWFDLSLAIVTAVIEIPAIRDAYNGQAYAWLSVFQIMRVYRVVLAVSITRELILLVLKHVTGVLNLILFVFLLTFLASIFAVQLFRGEIPTEQPSGISLYTTFSTIYNAYLGMYQILSSENWTDILYTVQASETQYSTSWIGAIFICLWFVFAFFITLNMFIAVIQENFDVSEDQKRVQQVRMFLQQKEMGSNSQGTLSLSTIFKFGRVRRQDPLDFGSAATDTLLKDGIIKEFLDDGAGTGTATSAHPSLHGQTTFDILQGKDAAFTSWWKRIFKRWFNSEPNPFFSRTHLTTSGNVDPRILAEQVVTAAEQRRIAQRAYLRRHPNYNVSLYLFRYNNPVRKLCQRLVGPGRGNVRIEGVSPNVTVWYAFSAFIYLAIVAMVILACITTPLYQLQYFRTHSHTVFNWFTWTDVGFATLFTVEAIIKVIADGFFWAPHAYFRSSWGFIDGIVLLTLWIDVITSIFDPGGGSRAVGAFKALRALRLLNVSDSARDTFHSVIVLGGWKVVSAAFVSISLLIPFAIYGLNLFAGKMMFCSQENGSGNPINSPIPIVNLTDCVGEFYFTGYNWPYPAPRQVRNSWYSFDDFGDALFVLFEIVSQEGWVQAMWSAQSISGIFTQPTDFASQGNAIYFVIFNLLGAVFVLTLFVSVFMRNYTEQTGVAFLTVDQRSWLELRKLLRQVAPSKRPYNKKKREDWQEWCYRRAVTKTGWYQRSMTGVLILHLILLCLEFYPEPWQWARTRNYIFAVFTLIYVVNIVIRIIGLSWTRFRKSAWDVYSLLAVSGTLVTTILTATEPNSPDVLQVHKLFLVSIALLLIPRNNQLDQLFKTAAASLSSIANLLATWFVLFLVYAIAMTQAFGLTRFYYNGTNNINFRTVPKALILLFRMSVGENWDQIMEDFARVVPPYCTVGETYLEGDCGSARWARALFISWNILSMYIFVNLFISLIYESFSYVYQRSSGLSIISREEIRRFKQAWAEFDPNGTGFISKDAFPRFLGELSGVFEMRIYDGDFSVRALIDECKMEAKRASALSFDRASVGPAEIDIQRLNRRLAELPVDQIRRRRARMNAFYEEVLVSADPDRGISFNAVLMILAHYKVINDTKALKMEEFLRRRARLQRVEQAVNRKVVQGFFDTLYYSRRFRRMKEGRVNARVTAVPNLGIPEIFVQDESDEEDVGQGKKFDNIPYVAVTPVDYEPPRTSGDGGVGRAPTSGSDAGRTHWSEMRNRSNSIQSSAPPSPSQESYLSATRHRPSGSSSSIQPDWHFAAAMENAGGLSPPPSPGYPPASEDGPADENDGATRSRANSAVSQNEVMGMFQNSVWGRSMRRSATQRRRESQLSS
ncbi:Ion transport protein-domain-containing protein [Neohortaea acidophila]|uniref:Calcium-channel protein CCH1 n=1 Tax=Neohortaea acidophila TaxID=245834 RepID=A0A6A6PXI3_9PEZI|nr:Ion transport protein-domain-containing protein [Neohortaea acidophila]KAF2484444.1 Ion transport protein-domain-containing protein [Neohortaea acidophila]